jgi:hypothetical protein
MLRSHIIIFFILWPKEKKKAKGLPLVSAATPVVPANGPFIEKVCRRILEL